MRLPKSDFRKTRHPFQLQHGRIFLILTGSRGISGILFLMGWHRGLVGCGSHRNSENPIRNNLSLVSTSFFSGNFRVSTPAKPRCSPVVVFLFSCGGKVTHLQFRQQQIQPHFLLPLLSFF